MPEETIYRPDSTGEGPRSVTTPAPSPENVRTIRIPEEIARSLEAKVRGSAFPTLDAFVAFVLARLLESREQAPFSEEEEKRLKERLRSLGYID